MTRLHERTRRQVCRWAFIALCLVPTSVVLGWSVVRQLPGHVAAEAESLRALTGLHAKLGGLSHPLPGQLLYEDVELADPETGATVLRARVVEITQQAHKLLVQASQVELTGDGTADVWQLLERHLRRGTVRPTAQIYLSTNELTWHGPAGSQTLSDFTGRIGPTTQGIEADLKFRLAGHELVDLAALRIERKLNDSVPSTHVQFNTGGGRFPARVLAPLIEAESWLGKQAQFDGYLSFEERGGRWTGDLQGHLVGLDLDTLVSQHFTHTLSGSADLTIRKAIVADNHLVEADGSLRCGRGMIGRSLWTAGIEHLGMRTTAAPAASVTTTPFKQLACSFVLSRRGLQLFGECENAPGTVLTADTGVLWQQPSYDAQPVASLIRTLVPQSEVQVPASHESQWLIDVLPVPQVVQRMKPGTVPTPHLKLKSDK
ncbi:MAG: hypothetical protein JNM18_13295 [Planctomycetaceae bacterium]|nr:hypothetical protein [Planctomycetaceae bacterium]